MSGIEKEIDKLGRVVLPKVYRDKLNLKSNDKVVISLENSTIIISAPGKRCALCEKRIGICREIRLCDSCIQKVKSY